MQLEAVGGLSAVHWLADEFPISRLLRPSVPFRNALPNV